LESSGISWTIRKQSAPKPHQHLITQFTGWMLFLTPTNSVKAPKARHNIQKNISSANFANKSNISGTKMGKSTDTGFRPL